MQALNDIIRRGAGQGRPVLVRTETVSMGPSTVDLDREQEALEACRAARDRFRSVGRVNHVAVVDDFAITVHLFLGQVDPALELARGCLVLVRESGGSVDEAYAWLRVGEVHLRRRELSDALGSLDLARRLFREAQDLLGVAKSDRLRGEVLVDSGEPEAAVEAFLAARVMFDATGHDHEALTADRLRAGILHGLGRFEESARINQRLVAQFAELGASDEDVRWSAIRLVDNLFQAGQYEACVATADEHQKAWGDEATTTSRSYLELLCLRAAAVERTGNADEASWLADQVIKATPADQSTANTALCYEVRGRARLRRDEPGGSQDLAHAIALHLATGDVHDRARSLSEHFLPRSVPKAPKQADSVPEPPPAPRDSPPHRDGEQ